MASRVASRPPKQRLIVEKKYLPGNELGWKPYVPRHFPVNAADARYPASIDAPVHGTSAAGASH
jgi:hypothetical protein